MKRAALARVNSAPAIVLATVVSAMIPLTANWAWGWEESDKPPRLPAGDGIAAKYPGDRNIERDPAVVFADGFENMFSPADLRDKWNWVIHDRNMRITQRAGDVNGGVKALEFTIPRQETALSVEVAKQLDREQDVLFLRWYSKFEDDFAVPSGSVHNGGSISSHYFKNGRATPGRPADGRNKFLANLESENSSGESPGKLNIYCYHAEQGGNYGDHFFPSGRVLPLSHERSGAATFGPRFLARPDIIPDRGRWYCYEYMVKTNTPGRRDGRIACWLDGKLVADFLNLRLRDDDSLKIDRFGVGLYIANNTTRANTKWYDDVVAATAYIGPRVNGRPE